MDVGTYIGKQEGSSMKGTYTGADGREYRWWRTSSGGYLPEHHADDGCWYSTHITSGNWPSAKAALDDLLEQEREEWVYLKDFGARLSPDGQRLQWKQESGWSDYTGSLEHVYQAAYRAGLAQGQKIQDENVRELLEQAHQILADLAEARSGPDVWYQKRCERAEKWLEGYKKSYDSN